MCEDEDDSLIAAYGSHTIMHAVFFKQVSSDRSASWPVTLLPPFLPLLLLLLLCWASHRGVAGRTNLSLSRVGELMPGTLGRVWKCFLNWLCGKIRKKKAGKLLILDLYPPPPHSCRSESWPAALRHQKPLDGLIGTVFSSIFKSRLNCWVLAVI